MLTMFDKPAISVLEWMSDDATGKSQLVAIVVLCSALNFKACVFGLEVGPITNHDRSCSRCGTEQAGNKTDGHDHVHRHSHWCAIAN